VVVLLALLVMRLGFGAWAAWRLQGVAARITAAYGPLDTASLAPPGVPAAENRARILSAAASLTVLAQDARKVTELGKALSAAGSPDPAQRVAVLRRTAGENAVALSLLDHAESRPGTNWEIPYADGPGMRVPPLMEIRMLAYANAAAALAALADGQADEAARRARLGLVLADALSKERILIVQLIRAAVERTAAHAVREVLAGGEPSPAALEALASRLAETSGESHAVTGLTGEMKYMHALVADVAGKQLTAGNAANRSPSCAEAALAWILRPLTTAAQARMLDQFDQTIRYARLTAGERASGRVSFPLDAPEPWWWKPFPWLQYARSGLTRAIASSDENEAVRALASTAVALRRHRLAHGASPAALAELDASLLARPPIDPYTGRPIEYARDGSGFTLRIAVPASAARNVELKDMFVWKVPR
jgi:hypothetical protein